MRRHDLRTVPAALASWAGAAWLVGAGSRTAVVVAVVAVVVAVAAATGPRRLAVLLGLTAVGVATVAASVAWRLAAVESSPVRAAAQDGRVVTLDVQVRRDARTFSHHGAESTVVSFDVRRLTTRHGAVRLRARVTAFLDGRHDDLVVGRGLRVLGRLGPPGSTDEAATLDVVRRSAGHPAAWWWEGAERARAGVRDAVAHVGREPRALVPALVDGDDGRIPPEVERDFQRAGLTHLTAVSGTNLTIVLAVVLVLGRAAGIRRRGTWVLGTVAIVAFVLLARPDPSVVRAAAMGAVGLASLGYGSRGGLRALSCAVVGLLFLDPWLARSAGFVLSVCATAGILLLAPVLAGRLQRWMPRWAALAVAVPLAAQLACTPALAAVSGEVSLVAVVANVLAGPAVAPATVAGLVGGLLALVSVPVGQVVGTVAAGCAGWILQVGHHAAGLDAASVAWEAPWVVLLVVVPLVAWALVRGARNPVVVVGLALGLLVGTWRPPQTGWPPDGWVMVACDVGQGDATVLPVAPGEAVVVDTGPEPEAVDLCLDRLGVRRVRLLVLTHAHADHVDGWAGVVDGRRVDQVAVGASGGPAVDDAPVHLVSPGERFVLGATAAEVLWPERDASAGPNDASVVLMATVRGVRVLLTGDVEPEAQDALRRRPVDLRADVLKMPHHGSGRQSAAFFAAVSPRVVTISAGEDNDYGHPAGRALELLRRQGVPWWRTDQHGDLAVVVDDGGLRVVTR